MSPAVSPPDADHPRPLQAFWRALTRFDKTKVNLWMGFRNMLGIVLPLAVGVDIGRTGSGLVASTGALNVAAADGVDSYRNRAARMLASSVIGAVAVFTGALVGHHSAAVIAGRALWSFVAGLVVCLGAAAADIGAISLVVFIVYTAQSLTPEQAALAGCIALGGGLLQTGLSIALWPLRGYLPERRLIGDVYRELARSVEVPAGMGTGLLATRSTEAHEMLSSLAGDHRVEAERLLGLASQAERIHIAIFALGRWQIRMRRETGGALPAAAIDRFLVPAAKLLDVAGRCLRGEPLPDSTSAWLADLKNATHAFRLLEESDRNPALQLHLAEARHQVDTLSGEIRAALDLARNATPAGEYEFQMRELRTPWHLQFAGSLASLRANLSLDSSACRHAIRLTLCILIGDLIAYGLGLPRSYWLAMTIAIVLKPDFGSTFSRGALRLAGTYVGLMLATLLFHFVTPDPWSHVLWIGVLCFFLRSLGRANYGVLVAAVSALIVFMFSMIGIAPKDLIAARALNTTIGGALALAVYLVWPTRERTQVPPALATMLDDYRLYFQAVTRAFIEGASPDTPDLDGLRTNMRRSRSNVETSVDRLSAEPYVDPIQVRTVNAMLASSHRFVHAVMTLEAGQTPAPLAPADVAFRVFAHDAEKMLYFLAARLRGSPVSPGDLPNLREDHNRLVHEGGTEDARHELLTIETDRMANSLNTLAEQVFRWAGTPDLAVAAVGKAAGRATV